MSAVLRAQLPEAADVGLGDHLVFRLRTPNCELTNAPQGGAPSDLQDAQPSCSAEHAHSALGDVGGIHHRIGGGNGISTRDYLAAFANLNRLWTDHSLGGAAQTEEI